MNDAISKRENETQPLLGLLTNHKALKRKAEAFRRGPKGQKFLYELASYFGLQPTAENFPRIADSLPTLHVAKNRRPRKTSSTLLMSLAANFFVERTGSPQWEIVQDLLYAALPDLGRMRFNTIEKRLEDKQAVRSTAIQIPPVNKLVGREARKWVMILMQQASEDVLNMELEDFNRKRKKVREKRNDASSDLAEEADREREARTAWGHFIQFARKPLTSGQQKRIEPILMAIGGGSVRRAWRILERWRNWDDARETWLLLWAEQRQTWASIIDSLSS